MSGTILKKVKVTCPCCGFENNVYLEFGGNAALDFVLCDNTDGGCDEHFAIKKIVEFSVMAAEIGVMK